MAGNAALRRDAAGFATADALSQRTPGGYRSPQLATLLGQLQWVSVGAKPKAPTGGGGRRRDFERNAGAAIENMPQRLLILAQAGVDDPKSRKQLDPKLRELTLDC